jgi:predicted Zn-dependent protease
MDLEELEQIVSADPGNSLFANLAELLREDGMLDTAFNVCFAGLSQNPGCHKGRLILARLYYERGFVPFAVRELEEIYRSLESSQSSTQFIAKLLKRLGSEIAEQPIAAKSSSNVQNLNQISVQDKIAQPAQQAGQHILGTEIEGSQSEEVLAEVDFDLEEIDLIEEKK